MLIKVISGGQTGIDRMSLEAARELGVPTGGSAPKDFLTEDGADPSLQDLGLVALTKKEYKARTLKNVIDGDGTVIYGDLTAAPSLQLNFANKKINLTWLTLRLMTWLPSFGKMGSRY
jgi:hypothetical protein